MNTKNNKTEIFKKNGEEYERTLLTTLKKTKTSRGFGLFKFKDKYGVSCSLQDSSLATEPAIWLGVDDPNPQILTTDKGWQPYPIPEAVLIKTRMHLTQQQVIALLPILQHFAETGDYVLNYKKKK